MNIRNTTIIAIIILLGLSLFTTLTLATELNTGFFIQTLVIITGLLISASIIFGFWIEELWADALASVFFSLALANQIWLFTATSAFLPTTFGLLVNVCGLVLALSTVRQAPSWYELETYELPELRKKRKA